MLSRKKIFNNERFNEIVKIPKDNDQNSQHDNEQITTIKLSKKMTIWGKKKKKLNKMKIITNEDIINGIRMLTDIIVSSYNNKFLNHE